MEIICLFCGYEFEGDLDARCPECTSKDTYERYELPRYVWKKRKGR